MSSSVFFFVTIAMSVLLAFGSVRKLNFVGNFDSADIIGNIGLLNEISNNSIFSGFDGNVFSVYGTTFAQVDTDLSSNSSSSDGFSFATGNFMSTVTANNTGDSDVIAEGSNSVESSSTDTVSSASLTSYQTSSSNGAGDSSIEFQGSLEAQTGSQSGSSSSAGLLIQGSDVQQSDSDATSNVQAEGSVTTQIGFSQSSGTVCAGSGCPSP